MNCGGRRLPGIQSVIYLADDALLSQVKVVQVLFDILLKLLALDVQILDDIGHLLFQFEFLLLDHLHFLVVRDCRSSLFNQHVVDLLLNALVQVLPGLRQLEIELHRDLIQVQVKGNCVLSVGSPYDLFANQGLRV